MTKVTFNADFEGGFSINQHGSIRDKGVTTTGSFHRLTPEQFDALVGAFKQTSDVRTLTTDGKNSPPRTFRVVDILFGGLPLTLYADVPATVPADQLSMF